MKYEEAIKFLKIKRNCSDYKGFSCDMDLKVSVDGLNGCDLCDKAIDMAIEALKKQIPKKSVIKTEKEIPKTHNYGRLLRFHCPECGRFLVGLYEKDVERGGGISQRMKGCLTCLQAIDFEGYYHIDKLDEDIDWSE